MSCEDVQNELIEYHHRDLAVERTCAIAAHLASCSTCAVEYCRLDAELSGIASLLEEEPPPAVYRSLKVRAMQRLAPPWWRRLLSPLLVSRPIYQPTLVFAGALAIAIAVFAADSGRRSGAPQTAAPAPAAAGKSVLVDRYDAIPILAIDRDLL